MLTKNPYDGVVIDEDDRSSPELDIPPPPPIVGDRGEPVTKAPKKRKKWVMVAVVVILVGTLLAVGFVGLFLYNTVSKGKKAKEAEVAADAALQTKEGAGPSLGAFQGDVAKSLDDYRQAKAAAPQPAPATPEPTSARQPQLGNYAGQGAGSGYADTPVGKPKKEELTPRQLAEQRRLDGDVLWDAKGATGGPGQDRAAGQDMSRFYSQSTRDNAPSRRANPSVEERLAANPYLNGGTGGNGGGGSLSSASGSRGSSGSIGNLLASESYAAGSAMIRPDLKYLLIHGTTASCVLLPHIVTNYPGQTSCMINRDVYSADGGTVLIRSGSIATGDRKVAMKQGVAKVFVVWSGVETPEGVSIQFDSMAADQLGAAGLDAWIDNHIPERFAGAVALSLIDDGLKILADQTRNNGSVTFDSSTNNAQDMASIALENSINIPPTGHVDRATELTILIARDVDLRHIYGVR